MKAIFSSPQGTPRTSWRRRLTVECLEDRCTPSQVAPIATLGGAPEINLTQPIVISLQARVGQATVAPMAETSHTTDAGDSGSRSDLAPPSQDAHPVEATDSFGNNVFQTESVPSARKESAQQGDDHAVSVADNRESLDHGQSTVSTPFSAPTQGELASWAATNSTSEGASEADEGQANASNSVTTSAAPDLSGSGARLIASATHQGPATSDGNEKPVSGNGAVETLTVPVMAVPHPTGQTSSNQIGNLNAGVIGFGNATNLLQNSMDRSVGASRPVENSPLVVHSVPEALASFSANLLTTSDNTTSIQNSLSNAELFAPLLQVADLFQNPSVGNVGDLEAGIRHFLNDLTEGVEQAIELPGNTSLFPWAMAGVFSAAALELARRQLRPLAVESVPAQLATTRSSGFRHRTPRTPS